MADSSPPPIAEVRVRVFIDFWNFHLAMKDWRPEDFPLDWKKLGPCLARHSVELVQQGAPFRHEGLHLYCSYNPKGDGKLRDWLNTLDRFPGVQVLVRERKPKAPPKCPSCHKRVEICPECQKSMQGTVEKGIDTAIVTDMIRLAWEESYDVAVLVTSDRDFIPAVEFLDAKGRKVINASFPNRGHELARKCWGSFDITKALVECERPRTRSTRP